MSWKQNVISAGFGLFRATRLHRAAGDFLRGRGVILTFHRVRAPRGGDYAPNALLEIAPEFFDALLTRLRENGLALVSLDEALYRVVSGQGGPFAALTFDDGFVDALDPILPLLERHDAPALFYVAPGFADRSARLWWVELEEAIARLDRVELDFDGVRLDCPARDAVEKSAAFARVSQLLGGLDNLRLLQAVAALSAQAGVDPVATVAQNCLDWEALRELADHELASIGAHSISHPKLARLQVEAARREMAESRRRLEQELGRPVRHFAFPYGGPDAAGPREFTLAAECGFLSAATTRPGMIFPDHVDYLHALPRLSVNGLWQDLDALDILLSGAPTALWNGGRRLNIA